MVQMVLAPMRPDLRRTTLVATALTYIVTMAAQESHSAEYESTGHKPGDDETGDDRLVGRKSTVVPGHYGESLHVTHAALSRGDAKSSPNRPMFLCLHGWGSNEEDLADIMRYVAPYNDYASLRAPLELESPGGYSAGAYSWFHESVPVGEDLDYDALAAAEAIDAWVSENIPDERDVVPIGFSQGGVLAVHVLRVHPERYRAAITLSGFLAPGPLPGDERLPDREIPVFYGFGADDTLIPKYESYAFSAWLEEHTWLTSKSYHGLDHSVGLEEFSDIRQWLLLNDIASGVL